jgi:predicted ATPase
MRCLEGAVGAARAGYSQLVLLGGDAGVGKTRLIDELCSRWRTTGGVAVVGGCIDLGEVGIGYAPLIEVLRHLRRDLGLDDFDELLHAVASELRPLLKGPFRVHGSSASAVAAQTVALFNAVGEVSSGLLVVFEDIHWADASTRNLVAYLARNLRSARVTLIVSYRSDDVHRRHPLRPLLAEFRRNPAVEQVHLAAMTRSELTVLLAGIAGSVPDSVVEDIAARSEGNPFFAEELLALGGFVASSAADASGIYPRPCRRTSRTDTTGTRRIGRSRSGDKRTSPGSCRRPPSGRDQGRATRSHHPQCSRRDSRRLPVPSRAHA